MLAAKGEDDMVWKEDRDDDALVCGRLSQQLYDCGPCKVSAKAKPNMPLTLFASIWSTIARMTALLMPCADRKWGASANE